MSEQLQFAATKDPAAELDRFILGLLYSKQEIPLTAEERAVLEILRWHKGAANAKPLAEIATKLNTSKRFVKDLVKRLIEERGVPVGGSRQEPIGYFILVSRDDWTHALRPLVSEIRSIRDRVDALRQSPFFEMVCGQMDLDLDIGRKVG
jgi:hypothetical protein